jgi:phosphopentomutase
MRRRAIVIVLDGVGAGEAPDAADYGDVGSNSLANAARAVNGLRLPRMANLGLGRTTHIQGVPPDLHERGACGRCLPRSAGKDTVPGHWELMGCVVDTPFPTYPDGFPLEIITEFKRRTGRGVLANRPASGTVVIQEFGPEHLRSGDLIVYTSADSVFQVAAHEDVVPVKELHAACETARAILTGEHAVGRVIARPFVGDDIKGFTRTGNRRDYALEPPTPTVLDKLKAAGKDVLTVGKIEDIFAHRGITRSNHTPDNESSCDAMLKFLDEDFDGLLFVNLIEFDMIYGHRRDPRGYADALEAFDRRLPEIEARLRGNDLVIIAADHGVDPTFKGTDHTRECIPLLVFGPRINQPINLGLRETYADVAATLAEMFEFDPFPAGTSFLGELRPQA